MEIKSLKCYYKNGLNLAMVVMVAYNEQQDAASKNKYHFKMLINFK